MVRSRPYSWENIANNRDGSAEWLDNMWANAFSTDYSQRENQWATSINQQIQSDFLKNIVWQSWVHTSHLQRMEMFLANISHALEDINNNLLMQTTLLMLKATEDTEALANIDRIKEMKDALITMANHLGQVGESTS